MRCGRYAPSPTGRQHLGNLRTALLAWLQIRLVNGKFILRIDDLDQPRNKPDSLQQIIDDLHWLGLDWDEGPDIGGPNGPYLQSQRIAFYQQFFDQLLQSQHVFPCGCSRKDIANIVSAPHGSENRNIYPGTCRPPNRVLTQAVESAAWRFRVDDQFIQFDDTIAGNQAQDLGKEVGDFVIKRKDGQFAYQLTSIADDILMSVTDVVRAADLLDSTARQIALLKALQGNQPTFWHVPLMNDHLGERMSKRFESISAQQWQADGKTASQLVGQFADDLGLIDRVDELSANELLQTLTTDSFLQRLLLTN